MICPVCGTHIADGSVRCPACHAAVASTMAMPVLQGRWCPSCGTGVDWNATVCPHCGLPLEDEWTTVGADGQEGMPSDSVAPPEQEALATEEESTRTIPRIESAIPPEDDPTSKVYVQDEMPRAGHLVVASIASALLIGGVTLAITHPWNPDQYSIRATTEADTSMAGFPGTVESLSGQDSSDEEPQDSLSGDDATLAQLLDAHERLGGYAQRANESEAQFSQIGYTGTQEERETARREAEALAIDVSNLIEELGQVDVTSGTYVEDRDHLVSLGNWLRNRVDVLTAAWKASAESADPNRIRDQLNDLITVDHGSDGKSTYQQLFDDSYEKWLPQKAESGS